MPKLPDSLNCLLIHSQISYIVVPVGDGYLKSKYSLKKIKIEVESRVIFKVNSPVKYSLFKNPNVVMFLNLNTIVEPSFLLN